MFPTPIEKTSGFVRSAYRVVLPLSLFIWLVPLLGVMLTAMRGPGDITAGNSVSYTHLTLPTKA